MAQAQRLVAIGASAGGYAAVMDLVAGLPAGFAAAVCVVLHIGPHPSVLPELIQRRAALPAFHARSGQPLEPARVYIAPPDHHLVVTDTVVKLHRGPKENHTRPAIDPLFRSAALHWQERAIGVILSGQLDDGVAGLRAIADCKGVTMVQQPETAAQPEMPRNALMAVDADHVLPVQGLLHTLQELVARPPPAPAGAPPGKLLREDAASAERNAMENLAAIGAPSTFACCECGGVLWALRQGPPLRYRCRTGHADSSAALEQTQLETATQDALWKAVRALQEREILLRRLAAISESSGDARQAAAGRMQADKLRGHIEQLRRLIDAEPALEDGA